MTNVNRKYLFSDSHAKPCLSVYDEMLRNITVHLKYRIKSMTVTINNVLLLIFREAYFEAKFL